MKENKDIYQKKVKKKGRGKVRLADKEDGVQYCEKLNVGMRNEYFKDQTLRYIKGESAVLRERTGRREITILTVIENKRYDARNECQ